MNCFSCFQRKPSSNDDTKNSNLPVKAKDFHSLPPPPVYEKKQTPQADAHSKAEVDKSEDRHTAKAFTFRELAMATKNFRQECLLGEGGFGKVFRGTFQSSGQIVAVRQLDRTGTQGSKEFQADVLTLSLLQHPNLVKIIGYCADGDQRLLLYEYIPSGSLKNHLFANKKTLDWSARMKIAAGIAEGLEYLHEKANPPIIYRDLKSSNILLDETNKPRLSDYGLATLVQSGSKMRLSTRVMAGYGYSAPEYEGQGELTLKSDVYSFGVVLLELITGRKALDTTRPTEEENLVSWAQPIFSDPTRFPDMADPLLRKQFPVTSLNHAVGVAAMCLQEEPSVRPLIGDIVAALSFLSMASSEAPIPAHLVSILSARMSTFSRPSLDVSCQKKEDVLDSGAQHQKVLPNENKKNEQEDDGSLDSDSSVSLDHDDGSRDFGMRFSNRQDDSFPEGNVLYYSRKDTTHKSHDRNSDSSSGEERKFHDRQVTINSRLDSNVKSEDGYISPRHYDNMGISIMRSDEGSEFEYSRNSSTEDSDSQDDGRKH